MSKPRVPPGFEARYRKRTDDWVITFRYEVDGTHYRSDPFPTVPLAKAAKAKLDVQRQHGGLLDPTKLTFADVAAMLLEQKTYIAPDTRRLYESCLKKLLPVLGPIRIQKIKPEHLIRFQASKGVAHLAPSTMTRILAVASMIFTFAVRREILTLNPVSMLTRQERPKPSDKRVETLTVEQVFALSDAIEPRFRAFVILLTYTGLRVSEALAIQWQDIDFPDDPRDTGVIRVERTQSSHSNHIRREMKTPSSRRELPMPPVLASALKDHAARFSPTMAVNENGRYEDGTTAPIKARQGLADVFVFDFTYQIFDSAFRVARAACGLHERTPAGVHKITPHTFRHTYASFLLHAGVDVSDVSAMMGHSSPKTTMEIYAHVIDKELGQAKAAKALEEAYASGFEAGRTEPAQVLERGQDLGRPHRHKATSSSS
jgi:integrase